MKEKSGEGEVRVRIKLNWIEIIGRQTEDLDWTGLNWIGLGSMTIRRRTQKKQAHLRTWDLARRQDAGTSLRLVLGSGFAEMRS